MQLVGVAFLESRHWSYNRAHSCFNRSISKAMLPDLPDAAKREQSRIQRSINMDEPSRTRSRGRVTTRARGGHDRRHGESNLGLKNHPQAKWHRRTRAASFYGYRRRPIVQRPHHCGLCVSLRRLHAPPSPKIPKSAARHLSTGVYACRPSPSRSWRSRTRWSRVRKTGINSV